MGRFLHASILVLVFSTLLYSPMAAQNNQAKRSSVAKVWLNGQLSKSDYNYLYQLGDSSIFLAEDINAFSTDLIEYPITEVHTLHLRRKGNIFSGVLLGAAAGFLINGVSDLLRQRNTQSACAVCPLLSELEANRGPNRQRYVGSIIAGGVVGGILAGIKVSFTIGGSPDRYQYHKSELSKYSLYR